MLAVKAQVVRMASIVDENDLPKPFDKQVQNQFLNFQRQFIRTIPLLFNSSVVPRPFAKCNRLCENSTTQGLLQQSWWRSIQNRVDRPSYQMLST